MEILSYFGCALFGLSFGYYIAKVGKFKSCQHKWKLFHQTEIVNYNRYGKEIIVGFVKTYECEHCKKLKKEQLMVND